MIHDYEYEQAMPYKYIKYRKQDKDEFSEEIKSELDNYYRDIRKLTESNYQIDGKADIKKLTKDLGGKYKSIRARLIIPFTGKESYLSQELDFLFVCCYELYLKFNLNQTEMNKIWGIDGDRLERLDWYPHRSFSAYHSVCDKTLKPYDTDSFGAKIAKVMNQKVQAVYMCVAFTGITNDLDLFANVSVDRNKCFLLTSPLNNEELYQLISDVEATLIYLMSDSLIHNNKCTLSCNPSQRIKITNIGYRGDLPPEMYIKDEDWIE